MFYNVYCMYDTYNSQIFSENEQGIVKKQEQEKSERPPSLYFYRLGAFYYKYSNSLVY